MSSADIRVSLGPTGETLDIDAPAPLTDEQRSFLRSHKPALIAYLREIETPPPLSPAEREAIAEAIEERAAIHQYDAGMTRKDAEEAANLAMRAYRYRLTDRPRDWLTLITPGCDLSEARRWLEQKFTAARVLTVTPIERNAQ